MVNASEVAVAECVEPAEVHLDDLDFMGNLHNCRYPLLVERALVRIWARAGYSFVDGVPTHPDVVHVVLEQTFRYRSPIRGVGRVNVCFRMQRLGRSSMVYAFRVVSEDGQTVHAEGTRAEVNVDMASLGSAPWAEETRDLATKLFGPLPEESAESRPLAGQRQP
ncbi:thioesterase family protein [Streptomyces sp. NA02950]|uniref:acyl-CoA thioesterase n=1 Tax=Streptomyces sp. NA02950 TaxID=2742137 RepID=UPI00159230C2|nr:thioesterase family protein [Streptomyces sp. NA02950]QKV96039.1 thioesterase family protein [Streptomyces sp. NA02950]